MKFTVKVVLLILALAVAFKFGFTLLAVGLLVAASALTGWIAYESHTSRRDQRAAERHEEFILASRAESQNARAIEGDERGIYGQYPPERLSS